MEVKGDVFLIKYYSSGLLDWYETWGSTESESGKGIILDNNGSVYISGYKAQNSDGSNSDLVLLKYNLDTDEDGLIDWDEINIYNTNPNDSNSDGDGFSDGEEVDAQTDPNDPSSNINSSNDSSNILIIIIIPIILLVIGVVIALIVIIIVKKKTNASKLKKDYSIIESVEKTEQVPSQKIESVEKTEQVPSQRIESVEKTEQIPFRRIEMYNLDYLTLKAAQIAKSKSSSASTA